MKIQDQVIFDSLTKTAKIMRDGIYYYRASEVGDNSRSPSDIVKVNRDKREVEKALNRFRELGRLPLTIEHPSEFLNLQDENSFKEGEATDPSLSMVGQYTTLDCKMNMNDEAAALYQKGIKQLSCGWEGRFVKVEGKDYDYEQEFVDFNHIAILRDGRAGSLCAIIDNNLTLIELMTVENIDELKKSLLDTVTSGIKDAFGAMVKKKVKKTKDEDYEGDDEDAEEDLETEDKADKKVKKAEEEVEKKVKDAAILDEAVKVAVTDARTALITDFSSILEAIEKGIVKVSDCSGKEPSEIKKLVVEKLLDKKVEDSAELNAYYNVALSTYSNPKWNPNPAKIIADSGSQLKNMIDSINFLEK